MKHRFLKLLALALLVFLPGCIPSLQPWYTEKDLVSNPALTGKFVEANKDPASGDAWVFEPGEGKSLKLTIQNKNQTSPFNAALFSLDGQLFLDLIADNSGFQDWNREDTFKTSIIPGHLIFKVKSVTPTLVLHTLDPDWVGKYLEKTPAAVPHTKVEDRLVFTGETPQLQAFLRKIKDESGAWGGPGVFRREEPKGSVGK